MKRSSSFIKLTLLAVASAGVLSACGGGGSGTSVSGVASGNPSASGTGTAIYTGPIGGFGSVIVNGMRFSSVGATLKDDDGNAVTLNQLKLGMTVRVNGSTDDATQLGTASQLEVIHGTRGTVTAINTGLGTINVLGQTIKTDSATAYQGIAGLAALTLGTTVEIYGSQQADGTLIATLIEAKTITALSLDGVVSNLNTTANTFQVGTLFVSYNPRGLTGNLVNGARVKVKAAAGGLSGNVLNATAVQVLGAGWAWGSTTAVGVQIKVKGVVDTAPLNGMLTLSGTPVNVAKAVTEGGSAITAGNFIEVRGTWDGTTLQATKIELEGAREARIGGRNELYGAVSNLNGNTALVNGVTVDLSSAVFSSGKLSQLSVGSYVEVKGNLVGNILQATKVELKNGSAATGVSYEQFGQVTDFVSLANFKLNGVVVDASQAVIEGGMASAIANKTYLEIKATENSKGVLVASKVEVKSSNQQ